MSGIEAIVLVGLLANIAQFVEQGIRLVDTAVSFYRSESELPKTLRELKTVISIPLSSAKPT